MQAVRLAVLAADAKIVEHVKWNAPSFGYADDRVTFNLRSEDEVVLIFHRGAKAKGGTRPKVADPAGLLEWLAPDRAVAKLSPAKAKAKKAAIATLAAAWIRATS